MPRYRFGTSTDPLAYAEHLLRSRHRRSEHFPQLKGDDPSWAILLDLFVQQKRGRSVSIQSACIAAGAPSTTALRHLTGMIARGEVIRTPDPSDARRAFVSLAPATQQRLLRCLEDEAMRVTRVQL